MKTAFLFSIFCLLGATNIALAKVCKDADHEKTAHGMFHDFTCENGKFEIGSTSGVFPFTYEGVTYSIQSCAQERVICSENARVLAEEQERQGRIGR